MIGDDNTFSGQALANQQQGLMGAHMQLMGGHPGGLAGFGGLGRLMAPREPTVIDEMRADLREWLSDWDK